MFSDINKANLMKNVQHKPRIYYTPKIINKYPLMIYHNKKKLEKNVNT